jgi:hypothetical protein
VLDSRELPALPATDTPDFLFLLVALMLMVGGFTDLGFFAAGAVGMSDSGSTSAGDLPLPPAALPLPAACRDDGASVAPTVRKSFASPDPVCFPTPVSASAWCGRIVASPALLVVLADSVTP